MNNSSETEVLEAAARLVDDFASDDSTAYFSHFSPDATFVFYTHPSRLDSRAEYEALWASWVEVDDFRVLACQSTQRRVQLLGNTAIFTHGVETTVSTHDGVSTLAERETIVFARQGEHWVAVHEHLSPAGADVD